MLRMSSNINEFDKLKNYEGYNNKNQMQSSSRTQDIPDLKRQTSCFKIDDAMGSNNNSYRYK